MKTLLAIVFLLTRLIAAVRDIGIAPIDDLDDDCRRNILKRLDLQDRISLAQVSLSCRFHEMNKRRRSFPKFLRRVHGILQSEDYLQADLNFLAVFDLSDFPTLFGHRSVVSEADQGRIEAYLEGARDSMQSGTGEFVFRRLEVLLHYRMSEECTVYVSHLPPTLTVRAEIHLNEAHPALATLYRGRVLDMCDYQ